MGIIGNNKKRLIIISSILSVVLVGSFIFFISFVLSKSQKTETKFKKDDSIKITKNDCPQKIILYTDNTASYVDNNIEKKLSDIELQELYKKCPGASKESAVASTTPTQASSAATSGSNATNQHSTSSPSTTSRSATASPTPTTPVYSTLSMITPYINEGDIDRIAEAYSENATSPWGFQHDGIDFMPKENLTTFRAAADGIVNFSIFHNTNGGKWQVSLSIDHNPWSINYAFEPFTFSEEIAKTQLGYISVQNGSSVKAGDILGKLLIDDANGAHVHFAVHNKNGQVCPQTYFTTDAYNSIMNLIHASQPSWNMCY